MAPLSTTADARDLDPWGFGADDACIVSATGELIEPLDEFVDDDEEVPAVIARGVTPAGYPAPVAVPLTTSFTPPATAGRAMATLRLPVSTERIGVLALFGAVIVAQAFYIGFSLTGEAAGRPGVGEVLVSSHPSGARVTVDGRVHGTTPLVLALDAGAHAIELAGADGPAESLVIDVEPGVRLTRHVALPAAAPIRQVGTVRVDTGAAAARVLIDDAVVGEAPARREDVPAGDHTVTVQFARGGSVTRRVSVPAGESIALLVEPPAVAPAAAAAPASGWLSLSVPFEAQVLKDGEVVGTTADGPLRLSAGTHALELVNADLGYHARITARVAAGKTATMAVDAPRAVVHVNAMPWAEVRVDGRSLGETPLANVPLPIGRHTVTFAHPELGERVASVMVRAGGPNRIAADLRKVQP